MTPERRKLRNEQIKRSRQKLNPIYTSIYVVGQFRDELQQYIDDRPMMSRNSVLVALLRKGLHTVKKEKANAAQHKHDAQIERTLRL